MFSGEYWLPFETKVTALPTLISASPTTPTGIEPIKVVARPNRDRLIGTIEQLASIGAKPDGSVCRRGFSPEDVQGRELLAHWMKQLGMQVRVDAAGNLIGRLEGLDPHRPCLLYTSPSPRDRQKSRMPSSA